MELWKCILISLFGIVNGQELEPPSLRECCKDGRDRASGTQECTTLPLISSSHICRIAQEQCCAALVGEILCNNGINMARMKGACERPFFEGDPWESKTSKMCCDCCVLGLMAAGRGLNCDLGLSLGRQCAHVTQTCCTNSTELFSSSMLTVTKDPVVNTTSLTVTEKTQPNACKDSKCSHLCVGIGTCACPPGYKLKEDELNCEDINECLNRLHNCITGQTCINTEGSFRCQRDVSCGTGYELTDNNSCQDIDECAFGTHNCVEGFVCANTPGSFRCYPKDTCGDGYIQDAIGSCIDVNECVTKTSPCLPAQTCINTVGSYTCRRNTVTCGRGYHLNQDGTRCEDVDECRGAEPCVGHGCVNLLGSYRCECKPGFIFNSITKLCEDINECRHYPGRLCAHKCENTEGSYKCSCTKGFKLAYDSRNCDDVNECEANPCSQECSNVYGSYQCYCRRGYQLSDIDGITCEDIDECALPTGGHVCSYRCSNAPGSFYCTCPATGYTLALNGRTCQDIDECAAGTHTCTVTESCFNVQGGFRCLSFECPPMFRRSTEGSSNDGTVNLRCVKYCLRGEISCALDPVHLISQTVLSLPTFREFSRPEEIVFLRTMAQASPTSSLGASDVVFEIVAADDQNSFDVVKRFDHDTIMGVVRQVKPITGPKNIVLKVAMNYKKSGITSHSNIVVVHIFVSEFWF